MSSVSGGRAWLAPTRRPTNHPAHVRLVLADIQPRVRPRPRLPQDMSNKGRDAALASELWLAADALVAKALAHRR